MKYWFVLVFGFVGFFRSSSLYAYDFYLNFNNCKSIISYLVPSKESLKTIQGEPYFSACERIKSTVKCDHMDPKGNIFTRSQLSVVLDSSPNLYLSSSSGGEVVKIDTVEHIAASNNRAVDEKYLGSKVCSGVYLTESEKKLMK